MAHGESEVGHTDRLERVYVSQGTLSLEVKNEIRELCREHGFISLATNRDGDDPRREVRVDKPLQASRGNAFGLTLEIIDGAERRCSFVDTRGASHELDPDAADEGDWTALREAYDLVFPIKD